MRNAATYVSIGLALACIIFTLTKVAFPTLPLVLLTLSFLVSRFENKQNPAAAASLMDTTGAAVERRRR